jgi:hypothetical protein
MKDFLGRRWKPLTLIGIAVAGFTLDKFFPQLELERKLVATIEEIVSDIEP